MGRLSVRVSSSPFTPGRAAAMPGRWRATSGRHEMTPSERKRQSIVDYNFTCHQLRRIREAEAFVLLVKVDTTRQLAYGPEEGYEWLAIFDTVEPLLEDERRRRYTSMLASYALAINAGVDVPVMGEEVPGDGSDIQSGLSTAA